MKRRSFVGTTLMAVNLPLALTLGLLKPSGTLAAWPADAFSATALEEALCKLIGDSNRGEDGSIETVVS